MQQFGFNDEKFADQDDIGNVSFDRVSDINFTLNTNESVSVWVPLVGSQGAGHGDSLLWKAPLGSWCWGLFYTLLPRLVQLTHSAACLTLGQGAVCAPVQGVV